MRWYVAAFGCIWCVVIVGICVGIVVTGDDAVVLLPMMLGMLVFGSVVTFRTARMAVIAEGDLLTIRDQLRTRRRRRGEVEGFRIGTFQAIGKVIYVLLTDGDIIALDVTFGLTFLARSRARQAEQLAALQNWLADRNEPGPTPESGAV